MNFVGEVVSRSLVSLMSMFTSLISEKGCKFVFWV